MALSEKTRHELHSKLEQVLGPSPAGILMEMLPPVGWADVATKRDLDALGQATKSDMEALATATKRDLDALGHATKSDMETLEHKLVATFMGEMASVRAEMASVRGEMAAQTRTILFALVGILVPYAGVIFAAAKLA